MSLQAINPATGDTLATFEEMNPGVLGGKILNRGRLLSTYSADRRREQIDSGIIFVNEHARSNPPLPFGGIKESGYGRELSYYGIKEFVNIKTICVA